MPATNKMRLKQCLRLAVAFGGLLVCAGTHATLVNLSDRGWSLQVWGGPRAIADASPNVEDCAAPPRGGAALAFSKTSKRAGDAELILPGVLTPGKAYEFSVPLRRLRGDGAVDVFFRRDSAYYETTSIKTVQLSPNWELVSLKGIYDAPRVGSVRLGLRSDESSVCVGRPQLREIDPDAVGAVSGWQPVSPYFFGIHLNKLGRHNGWPSFEPDVIRMWGTATTWGELQQKPGRTDWRGAHGTRLDYFVRHTLQRGRDASILMTLGMTPVWASVAGDNGACARSSFGERSCMPPANLDAWRAFVRELAQRYADGRITLWELWNEADVPTHWLGSPQLMAELARIARDELRKADPKATLIGPNITANGLRFLNDFLVAGGGRYVDGLSLHVYLGLGSAQAVTRMRNAREIMRGHGLDLPIWNTESNTACIDDPDASVRRQPGACDAQREATVLQAALLHAAQGFANFTFYTWEGAELEVNGVGMVQEDFRTKTRLGGLYEELTMLLRRGKARMLPAAGPITRMEVLKDGRSCVVAWSGRGVSQAAPSVFEGMPFVREFGGKPLDRDLAGAWTLGAMPALACRSDGARSSLAAP